MFKGKAFSFRGGLYLGVRSPRWVHAAVVLVLWATAPAVLGADWFFQPAVTVGTAYEENAELAEEDTINTTRYDVEALARGGRLTERSQIIGRLRAFWRRYGGHEELDSDNLSAELGFAFLPTELDQLSLDLSFDRDTTRSSELTTTGNITENVPRDSISFAPAWQRQLTERSTLGVGYTYTQVDFDDNESGFVNSEQDEIDAFYSYQLTEQLDLRGTLSATSYDPDDDQSYKGYEALLGMGYAFSETLAGNLDIGWQRIDRDTDLDAATSESTASGFVYGFSLSKAFERSSFNLSLRRDAQPTGSGEPLVQERLQLGYAYQFSPRLSVTIPIGIFRNKLVSFGDTEEDDETRIFFTTEPSLNWRVTEEIVFSASYRYQYQHYEEADSTAEGNAVFLSLSYVWPTEIPGLSR